MGRWHRVCDTCGSHYELQPLLIHVGPEGEPTLPELSNREVAARARALVAQISPERLTEEARRSGVIYGGWAVRACFPA
ncbi:hypothetical protein HRbin12_01101 [bacterium HR12]|nr:hypothetical protein HRbin12_01101 [bacterium HR12]